VSGRETRNSELETSSAAALWLCQLPGLATPLLLRLLARWGSAEQALRAPSHALREEGLPPALVARFMAAPRELPRVVDGLRALRRLGVTALPVASAEYPERLRRLAAPPAVVYIQGCWPPAGPVVLLAGEPQADDVAAAWRELAAAIGGEAVVAAPQAWAAVDNSVRLVGLASGVLRAGSSLPRELLNRVSAGQATLLSTTAPGAAESTEAAAASFAALAALADVVVVLGGAAPSAAGAALFVYEPSSRLPHGARKLRRGKAGAKALRAALGIHKAGEQTAHQERLF